MRNYTTIDLLRFRTFANENPKLNGVELIRGYNEKYPELSVKQKMKNLANALNMPGLLKANS